MPWPPPLSGNQLRVQDWEYLAEGSANILFRYVGPDLLPFVDSLRSKRMALRLRKTCAKPTSETTISIDEFISDILENILPKDTLPFYRRVPADAEVLQFLKEISKECESVRPRRRRESGSIDLEPNSIFATQDLTSGASSIPCFVAEIKPKCGFLHEGHTRDPNKRLYSRYRMHSILKAELKFKEKQSYGKHHAADVSRAEFEASYDPIDLFSTDSDRIRAAVTGLCSDFVSSRAKNLKIWYAGKHLVLPRVCLKCLTQDMAVLQNVTGVSETDPHIIANELVKLLLPRIMHPQIRKNLDTLVKEQARLDSIGIEGITTAWDQLTGSRLQDCAMENLSELQATLLAPASLEEYRSAAARPPSAVKNVSDLRTAIVAHLLSATLKDVSFFLDVNINNIETQIHWVDLDPKSVRKLPSYALVDAQISDSFTRWLELQTPGS